MASETHGEAQPGSVGATAAEAGADGPTPARPAHRTAAGIYGTVVTASVLATAGGSLRTVALVIAVLVTLVVYWMAEEYAELGEHAAAGRLPLWGHVRTDLSAKWPMVTASGIPLVALVVARVLGASAPTAALLALVVTVVLLMVHGWTAGRAAGLPTRERVGFTGLAGVLGLLMVALKVAITHLH